MSGEAARVAHNQNHGIAHQGREATSPLLGAIALHGLM